MQHFNRHYSSEQERLDHCERAKERLRYIERALTESSPIEVIVDGTVANYGWGRVLKTGMYDGWTDWIAMPSILVSGPVSGTHWRLFTSIVNIRSMP